MDDIDPKLAELDSRLQTAWVDPRDYETVGRVRQRLLAEMARSSAVPKPWWRRDWPVSSFAVGFAAGAAAVVLAVGLAGTGHLPLVQLGPSKGIQPSPSVSAQTSFLPACLAADIPLTVDAPATTGSVIITVRASNTGFSCHLRSKVTVAPAVMSSSATAPAETDLPFGASGTPLAVVAWANWCGAPGPFTVNVAMAEQQTSISLPAGPRCIDRARPSQLVSLSTPAVSVVPLPLAKRTITAFYDAINAHDYANAYAYLGTTSQLQQPYEKFVAGFADTVHDELVQLYVQTIKPDGTVAVHIDFIAHRTQDSSEYAGTYVIGYEGGEPHILSAQVSTLWTKPQP
jgi:hypothetical protein